MCIKLTILENFSPPKKITRTVKFEYHKRCTKHEKFVSRQIRELRIWKNILTILLRSNKHREVKNAVRELTNKFMQRDFNSKEDSESLRQLILSTRQKINKTTQELDSQQKKEIRKTFKHVEDRIEANYLPPKSNSSCSERNYFNHLWSKDREELAVKFEQPTSN